MARDLRADLQAKLEHTCEMKAEQALCDFVADQCPPELQVFYSYYTHLSFTQEPDYAYLKGVFAKTMEKEGREMDGAKLDWTDRSLLEEGTLIPEEYVVDSRFVEDVGIDPG